MHRFGIVFVVFCVSACGTTGQNRSVARPANQPESVQEVESAMGAVVGSVAGQPIEREDLHKLGQQIRRDPEAQSAVESITGAVGDPASMGKYCPVDGERYSAKFETCPKHQIPLKNIEE